MRSGAVSDRSWYGYGLFAACLGIHLYCVLLRWDASLLDNYRFRQTQTAITSYYFIRDGFTLAYETPVLGAPWSIPFEFPLFQAIAALVHLSLGVALDTAGRITGLFFFYALLIPVYYLVRRLTGRGECGHIALALILTCPLYIFWSRAFLIESTALCFSMLFVTASVFGLRNRQWRWLLVSAGAGIVAGLTKITVFGPAVGVVGIFILGVWLDREPGRTSRQTIRLVALLGGGILISLLVSGGWILYTDGIKAQNPIGVLLTSSSPIIRKAHLGREGYYAALWVWEDLLRLFFFEAGGVPRSGIWLQGGLGLLLTAGITAYLRRYATYRKELLALLAGFCLGPLVFLHPYATHDYYWYDNTLYLLIAVAIMLGDMARRMPRGYLIRGAVIPGIIASMLIGYAHTLYPLQTDESGRSLRAVANTVKTHTSPGGIVVIYGLDWDPALSYYAERRALMKPPWLDEATFKKALERTGKNNIETVVIGPALPWTEGHKAQIARTFGCVPHPSRTIDGIAVYVRPGR